MLDTSKYPALVLNADFTPVSVFPLEKWSCNKAVHAVVKERVFVVEEYDQIVHSQNITMRLPAVIAFRDYHSQERPAPYNRTNLYVRDKAKCQYCGARIAMDEMTVDHVHPRCRGGATNYLNCVAACDPCNLRKADRTLAAAGLGLYTQPRHPTLGDLNRSARKLRLAQIDRLIAENPKWRDYLQA